MKVLVAPQELKGTLTGAEAGACIARGLFATLQGVEIETFPIADGGPGTVEMFVRATGADIVEVQAEDALGRFGPTTFAIHGQRAMIEMAAASGLCRLFPAELEPLRASTRGTGQLITAALERGCKELCIGLGGSATTDGGAGMLEALGARFMAADGSWLSPGGGPLAGLERVKLDRVLAKLQGVTVLALSDVRAPLLGPTGAAAVFAPQKGATPEEVKELETALARLHQVVLQQTGRDLAGEPGAGAAGGLGYGLLLAGATMKDGFATLAELCGLRERVRRADLVVTAEGRLDAQTAMGKATASLATLARQEGKPVVVLAGSIADGAPVDLFTFAEPIDPEGRQSRQLPSSTDATAALLAAARRIAPRFLDLVPPKQD
ncbi:MAG TPA: glycerate kinase [Myxococcaceae bacterium]|nr:glycerate kinase [Myxococcaceae bacterium]